MGTLRDWCIETGTPGHLGSLEANRGHAQRAKIGRSRHVDGVSYPMPPGLARPRLEWKGKHEDDVVTEPIWKAMKKLKAKGDLADIGRFDAGYMQRGNKNSRGWPDLHGTMSDGGTLYIECKKPGGKLSSIQLARLQAVNGTPFGIGIVCCSLEGFLSWWDGGKPLGEVHGIPVF